MNQTIKFSITEALAEHLRVAANREGITLQEFLLESFMIRLPQLANCDNETKRIARESMSEPLLAIQHKKEAHRRHEGETRMEEQRQRDFMEQDRKNRESAAKIKALVDSMGMDEVRSLLVAINEKMERIQA